LIMNIKKEKIKTVKKILSSINLDFLRHLRTTQLDKVYIGF